MSSKTLIIIGSNREESNTIKFLKEIYGDNPYQLINLLHHHIAPYSYTGEYSTDDGFNDIVNVMKDYDDYVFATPVYWYSMSGLMKTFFDRLTDITTDPQKQIGKGLKGKSVSVIIAGSDSELPAGFEVPFMLTAKYFGMVFKGCVYKAFTEQA
jgi:multimeric flavodoxin WrbA